MACMTRDLLILKTAPDAGITMLSGVATDRDAKALVGAFSSGELIRMMEKLEQTMSGFTRSASRRLDAELCIISLCQPELELDAQSLNARLSRVEEQLKNGIIAAPPAPQTSSEDPDEELPPFPGDEDAPPAEDVPAPKPAPKPAPGDEAPVGFWADLVTSLRTELRPPVSGFFTTSPNALVRGGVNGNRVILVCSNSFTLEMINKPELLALVGRKASTILGRNVTAVAVDQSARPDSDEPMEQLMNFGRAHSDIVTIKD
jgi:DNA polymerase-3 subunit gamma/tau